MEGHLILASLKDLAQSERLTEDLDYEPKLVPWVVSLDAEGHFVGLVPTAVPQGPKGRLVAKTMQIPRRTGRTSENLADFLVDKPEYVLGVVPDADLSEKRLGRLEPRRLLFLGEIEKAAAATSHSGLESVALFLKSDSERREAVAKLQHHGYASNDLICFEVLGRLVHEDPQVRGYFSARREPSSAASSQCLICGEVRSPVDKHPSVQIRGGSSSGIALVSFNSAAFESYGWQRNENAPICRNCAEAYTTGLRRLVSNRYPDPRRFGEFLPRRSVGLSNDTVAIFWADAQSESLDWFADVFEKPDPQAVKSVLDSPWMGREAARLAARFYCLLISGGQGRAIIRGAHAGVLSDVEANVKRYLLAIQPFSEYPLPLFLLLRSLAVQGKADNLPPSLASEVFLAILYGFKYPYVLLSSAVQRCKSEQKVTRERAAIIQLYFQRNQGRQELTVGLNRECPDTGYRLGRLFAVLERLQGEANRNLNKTIVDRYYGAASTRPSTVFPSLIHLAQHHTGKARSPGFFQKEIGEVLEAVSSFPAHLSLEEQGLFALGYYHQRQEYFKRRDTAPNAETPVFAEGESNNE
jgi:CRISPR-associated protein Csd1